MIGGYQLQAGSLAQEFGKFLKNLEAVGQGTKTLWAQLVRQVYGKLQILGNFCSLGIGLWAVCQLWYNGSKIIMALKTQSYQLGLATIVQAFCYGITAFLLKSKHNKVLVTYGRKPSGSEVNMDMEAGNSLEDHQEEGWSLHVGDEHQDKRRP